MELDSLLGAEEQRWIDDLLTGVATDVVEEPEAGVPQFSLSLSHPLLDSGVGAAVLSPQGMGAAPLQRSKSDDFALWEVLEPAVPAKPGIEVGDLDIQDLSLAFLQDKAPEPPTSPLLSPHSPDSDGQAGATSSSHSEATLKKKSIASRTATATTGESTHTAAGVHSSSKGTTKPKPKPPNPQATSPSSCKVAEPCPSATPTGPATPEQSGSGGAACGAATDGSAAQSRDSSQQEDPPQDLDEKARARQMRNRESAAQSRVRKKKFFEELEQRCQQLEHANSQLNAMVQQLTSENASLKCQLASAYSGQPVPQPAGFGVPYGYSYFTTAPQPTPKIPIPAKRPTKRGPAGSGASGTKRTKTSKATSATSAVLLSVVCCVLFVASPWRRDGSMSYLPSSNSGLQPDDSALVRSGRVLTALNMEFPASANISEGRGASSQALEAVQGLRNDPELSAANSSLPQLSRPSTADLALPAVADPQTEIDEEVMEQLKKLGSLALDNEAASSLYNSGPTRVGGGSRASFPLMALSVFDHAGLMSPITCTEVMRFKRAEYGEASERQSRPTSTGSTGPYRGRKSFAIPLPPAGGDRSHGAQEPADGPKQRIGEDPDDVQVGTVVSVLFPSRNTTGVSGTGPDPNSVGQLYVVTLVPQSSYVAYRCDLPYAVEMRI